jgi:hypothetical protein
MSMPDSVEARGARGAARRIFLATALLIVGIAGVASAAATGAIWWAVAGAGCLVFVPFLIYAAVRVAAMAGFRAAIAELADMQAQRSVEKPPAPLIDEQPDWPGDSPWTTSKGGSQ